MNATPPSCGLYVSVPVASFRVPRAREYFESFVCPPPATVYGMLLALVGEPNRRAHIGAEISIALLGEPVYSVVLRTLWRIKTRKNPPGIGENSRPDFQELLSDVRLGVWVRAGTTEHDTPLAARVGAALQSPESVSRFGGLSLGESTHLVDEVCTWDDSRFQTGRWLLRDDTGDLAMPIWPNHVGAKGTVWGQYALQKGVIGGEPPQDAWTKIRSNTA